VWSGSGTELFSPFVVSNGQVFINDAVIGKLTADKITGGTYNVGGSNGYGCIRTTGKVFSDGKSGFFFETMANGNAAVDLVSAGSRFYMSPTQAGIIFGDGAFQVYSTGYMEINALNVIKRLNINAQSVVVGNYFNVSRVFNDYGNYYYWAANLGNTEGCYITIIYNLSIQAPTLQGAGDLKVGGQLVRSFGGGGHNAGSSQDKMVMTLWVPEGAVVELQANKDNYGSITVNLDMTILSYYR